MKTYDFSNFFRRTFANFTTCEMPERAPDFWTYSGSTYWDFGDRIIRWSNHWGIINNCYWYLDGRSPGGSSVAGECKYIEFKPVEQRLEWLYGNGEF